MSYRYFIGIDIAKDFFDVALHGMPRSARRFDNTPAGFSAFCKAFAHELPEAFIVLEATGGYETALLMHLCKSGRAVHRVQPLTARHYMKSLRSFGKNDALDAAALARYGSERHDGLCLFVPAGKTLRILQDLHMRREDLLAMRIAESQRLKHPRYESQRESVRAVRDMLNAQLAAIESRMRELIENDAELKKKKDVLTAVKSIGDTTARCLIACMPELGTLTRRKAASLAGLAPHPRDSGNHYGYRSVRGGRQAVRKALFMAAMSAVRYNPQMKAFYCKLIKNGKKPIVALVAVMRKIIVTLNAKIRDACYPELNFKTW